MNSRRVTLKAEGIPVGTALVKQNEEGFFTISEIDIDPNGPNVKLIHAFLEEITSPPTISINAGPHNHAPTQHRDGKEPWCDVCRLNKDYKYPTSFFRTNIQEN